MSDELELDQEDFYGRLLADAYLVDIAILLQRRGVTENDIERALSTLNKRGNKVGAVAIVLMPELEPENPNLPTPSYRVRLVIQVIEHPLISRSSNGAGKSAEQIAKRIRQVGHHFITGRSGSSNTWHWDGMQPEEVPAGKVSYSVAFRRVAGDDLLQKVATPVIVATPAVPDGFNVEITCATAGAAIQRSVDGSYPTTPHVEPSFHVAAGTTVRAAATLVGKQQSNVAERTIS